MKKKQPTDKPERVQFPKDADAHQILAGIKEVQDRWAKEFPERAHRLYPTIFDKDGNRIK